MRKMNVLFGLLILGSCATPYDLKKKKPLISYVSTKTQIEVKKCISKSWKSHLTQYEEVKTDSGWLLRHDDAAPGTTKAIVTIEGEAPEVSVNYYNRTKRLRVHRLEDEVRKCQ